MFPSMTIKTLTISLLTLFLTGCIYIPRPDVRNEKIELKTADFPIDRHAEQLNIAILPVANNIPKKLKDVVHNDIKSTFTIIEANILAKEKVETLTTQFIQIASHGTTADIPLPAGIDVIIVPTVKILPVKAEYQDSYTYTDLKKNTHTVPSKCQFEQPVNINLTRYSHLGKQHYKVENKEYWSYNSANKECPISQSELLVHQYKALHKRNLCNKNKYLEDITPRAPVLEAWTTYSRETALVRIGLGSNNGIKAKQDIAFFRTMIIDGKKENILIGNGYISGSNNNLIRPTYSWVYVEKSIAETLHKGDTATTELTNQSNVIFDLCNINSIPMMKPLTRL